jgi:hypothetical protein
MLFQKLKIQFSGQTVPKGKLKNSLLRPLPRHNLVSKTRLWQKTAQPTLAA